MKRFLLPTIIMTICAYIGSTLMPWWIVAAVCFVVALNFKMRGGAAFLAGLVAIFLVWLFVALVKDHANEQILSTRMAQLFKLNNSYLYIFIAALVGGLVGGFSAWSGALLARAFGK